jgi:3-dehydroquinate dehydratase-2
MKAPAVHVLNGPNLNLLGQREPHIYGTTTLSEVEAMCHQAARGDLVFAQTNNEGEMIEMIHAARGVAGGIIINPAGWSFHSIAILDALNTFEGPVLELHISNIHARDAAHRHSILSQAVTGVIAGLGANGYPVALGAIYDLMAPHG